MKKAFTLGKDRAETETRRTAVPRESEGVFAEIALGVLREHGIPCSPRPVTERDVPLRTGLPDTHRIYVPWERLREAEELIIMPFREKDI